jgi:SAM-dependent methyltransferase
MSTAPPTGQPADADRTQERINTYWNFRSATYDGSGTDALLNDAKRPIWRETLLGLLPPAPVDVLDVGTGTGFLALLLADLGYRVTGVDLSEGMLVRAREHAAQLSAAAPKPTFRVGDAIDPPVPPSSVDVVISRHVLWTLTDPVRAVKNWARLVRPGGRVIAIDGIWGLDANKPGTAPAAGAGTVAAQSPASSAPWRETWDNLYGDAKSSLPLFSTDEIEPFVAVFREADLTDTRLTRLHDIERVEYESTPDRGPSRPRFVITAHIAK